MFTPGALKPACKNKFPIWTDTEVSPKRVLDAKRQRTHLFSRWETRTGLNVAIGFRLRYISQPQRMCMHTHTRRRKCKFRAHSNAWSNDDQTLSLRIELLDDIIFCVGSIQGRRRPASTSRTEMYSPQRQGNVLVSGHLQYELTKPCKNLSHSF